MAEVSDSTAPTAPPDRPGRAGRAGFDWAGLRADLRGAVPDASLALVITLLIYWLLYARVANGTSATIEIMPMLEDADAYWMYWMCQAFGWSAMLWAYVTVVFGLMRSGPRPRWGWLPAARLEKWHRTTSLTTIALMFLHAFFFFTEQLRTNQENWSFGRSLWTAFVDVFVPGGYATGTGRVAILIGLLALYLAIPLGLAFYLRSRTGARLWLALHRFVIVVYILSAWHTLLYSTQGWFDGPFRTFLWATQLPIAGLLLWRLLAPARPGERLRARGAGRRDVAVPFAARLAARLLVGATLVGLVLVIVTGVDGGRPRDGASAAPWPAQWVIWLGLALFTLAVVAVVLRLRHRAGGPGARREREPAEERAPAREG
ncbi:ferric reductase-like transmembrane domain-containing protein [Streptomyces sp. DSM 44915]|uniref:Ferric reductase-like transmembrane domain-containing protein n=1 Tax=Streptomyces chisholmiae TaxID=3075540 RepID=A0ABU2JNY3_9ACTN|nr:ferric reductase-like transmembrane domain-containing protein [Streptomyces sp. DSM 44915]MDT0266690.1 ferric reductase-like transmembrane domain-containing protein [Streptomyces sp. DSM 44915]